MRYLANDKKRLLSGKLLLLRQSELLHQQLEQIQQTECDQEMRIHLSAMSENISIITTLVSVFTQALVTYPESAIDVHHENNKISKHEV